MTHPRHPLALLACLLVACGGVGPSLTPSPTAPPSPTTSAAPTASAVPTASPSPSPVPTPAPTPEPTPSPETYRSSEGVSIHPVGSVASAPLGYLEYLPPGYGDGTPRPVLLFFHGSAESGDGSAAQLPGLEETGIPRVIARDGWPADRPFVVLMPQFGPSASHCTDAYLIDEFIRFALDRYDIDPARVYLTGLSCGAYGGWEYLGMHTDEVVAAAVLIAGDGRAAFSRAGCPLGRVPIWAIHGGADLSVPPDGSIVPITELNECTDPAPVDARLDVYPGVGHAIWQPFYDGSKRDVDIYAWLLQYSNPPD